MKLLCYTKLRFYFQSIILELFRNIFVYNYMFREHIYKYAVWNPKF